MTPNTPDQAALLPDETRNKKNHYIVTVGASAGGLEAIHEFFDNMPESEQLSFIVIQHLSPGYKSLLVELVSKHTHMRVAEAVHETEVLPKHVYVIPPGKVIGIIGGRLQVEDKPPAQLASNVIDLFLTSLANDLKNKSIAVILSGTGSDGTKGCAEIRNRGGLVLVQDPLTARFDGMPNSAINSGHIDYILAPELMPLQIFEFIEESLPATLWQDTANQENLLDEIFKLLFKHTNCDFQHYKKPTILRRIARRMAHFKHEKLENYVELLRNDVEENQTLCKDFLIGVTKFFRDRQAFDAVTREVLPRWAAKAQSGDTFKMWVAACSTGQEAYSLAMVVHHFFQANNLNFPIKIFASDVDQHAIDVASKGSYPLSIEKDVELTYLEKYFNREGDRYIVRADLRKLVVFARHNVVSDPPFIRNDFVSCRNMLIYMDVGLQRKVLSTLFFSLNAGGYLFLGPSETPAVLAENLQEIDRKWKVFQKINQGKQLTTVPTHEVRMFPTLQQKFGQERSVTKNYEKIYVDSITDEYQFAGVFADKNYIIREAVGNYRNYLFLPEKNFQLNLTKMVPPDLSIALNSALRKSLREKTKVTVSGVRIKSEAGTRILNVVVYPPAPERYGFFFVVFSQLKQDDKIEQYEASDVSTMNSKETNDYIQELKAELNETESNLQHAIENLEQSNQELQSANEEMLSANEELQSSNEELQSLNEELHTLNTEHQSKIAELISLNDDLNNYLRNSDVGQVFIDGHLRIRKFNPVSTRMINLIETDLNRPLAHISTNLRQDNLISDIRLVMSSHQTVEKEVELYNGTVCLLRISPYVRQDKSVDGAVLTFIDVSALKDLNSLVKAVFNSTTNPVLAAKAVRDDDKTLTELHITTVNEAMQQLLNKSAVELKGCSLIDCFSELQKAGVYAEFLHVVESGKAYHTTYHDTARNAWFDVYAVKMREGIVITFNNITQLKAAEQEMLHYVDHLKKARADLEASNQDLQQFASVASHDLKEPLRKVQMLASMLKKSVSEKLNEVEQNQFSVITKATERMRSLIDDLLDFSKLSKETSFHPVDFNKLIEECQSDLELMAKEKNATITADDFPVIDGMGQKLRQLVQNLLSNALKFGKEGQPIHIQINSRRLASLSFDAPTDREGNYCLIQVQDNGIGFDQQYADKIFQMFHRLETNRSGTGIGLALCKKIVEQHHGIIRARGLEGAGAVIEVVLPIHQAQPQNGRPLSEQFSSSLS